MSRRHTICPLCESTLPAERDAQPLWDAWTAARGNTRVRGRADELVQRVSAGLEDLERLQRWLVTQGEEDIAERIHQLVREQRDHVKAFQRALEEDSPTGRGS